MRNSIREKEGQPFRDLEQGRSVLLKSRFWLEKPETLKRGMRSYGWMYLGILMFAEVTYLSMGGGSTLPLSTDKEEVFPYKVTGASPDLSPCYVLNYVP